MAERKEKGLPLPIKDIPNPHNIIIYRISGFDKADEYTLKSTELLASELEKRDLLKKGLGFRAFSPKKLKHVLQYGTDKDDNTTDLIDDIDQQDAKLTELITKMVFRRGKSAQGAFIVYDLNQLMDSPIEADWTDTTGDWTFKDLSKKTDAVVAVVVIEDFAVKL